MTDVYVTAKYDYKGEQGNLSFSSGDSIKVLTRLPSGWFDGFCKGQRGWFPSNYVTLPREEMDSILSPLDITSPNFPNPTSPVSVSLSI
jgi:SH3 domain